MTYRFRIMLFSALMIGLSLTLTRPATGQRRKVDAFPRLAGNKMDSGRWLAGARRQAKGKAPDMNMISLEVAAFRTLRTLRATRGQTEALLKLVKEDFVKDSKREDAKTTLKFRKALLGLRAEFRRAGMEDDDEDVKAATEKVDLLADDDEALDDGVDVTTAAGIASADAMRLFTPQQVFALLKSAEEEITDPTTVLLDALADGLTVPAEDWKTIRDDAASQVAWMIGGLNPKGSAKFRAEAMKWLDTKHATKMKPPEFDKQRAALRADANEKFKAQPIVVLSNIARHRMAELLSNPRLPAALKARLNPVKPK
jgi:hypothetical protein